jgi:hypothetical protein
LAGWTSSLHDEGTHAPPFGALVDWFDEVALPWGSPVSMVIKWRPRNGRGATASEKAGNDKGPVSRLHLMEYADLGQLGQEDLFFAVETLCDHFKDLMGLRHECVAEINVEIFQPPLVVVVEDHP